MVCLCFFSVVHDKVLVSEEDSDALFEKLTALKEFTERKNINLGRDGELAILFAMQSIAVDHNVPSGKNIKHYTQCV